MFLRPLLLVAHVEPIVPPEGGAYDQAIAESLGSVEQGG